MKYNIEGFSQRKLVEFGLDSVDAIILRWFVDFYATNKMVVLKDENDKEFKWVNYGAIIEDLPILKITNREVIARRFKKMENCGILEHWTCKNKGTFSCYRIGDKYNCLIEENSHYTNKQYDSKVDRGQTQK